MTSRNVVPLFASPIDTNTPVLQNPFDSPTATATSISTGNVLESVAIPSSMLSRFDPAASDKSYQPADYGLSDINVVSWSEKKTPLSTTGDHMQDSPTLSPDLLLKNHKVASPQSVPLKSTSKQSESATKASQIGRFKVKDITVSSTPQNIQPPQQRLSLSSGSIESAKQHTKKTVAAPCTYGPAIEPLAALELAKDGIQFITQQRDQLVQENNRLKAENEYLRQLLMQYSNNGNSRDRQ